MASFIPTNLTAIVAASGETTISWTAPTATSEVLVRYLVTFEKAGRTAGETEAQVFNTFFSARVGATSTSYSTFLKTADYRVKVAGLYANTILPNSDFISFDFSVGTTVTQKLYADMLTQITPEFDGNSPSWASYDFPNESSSFSTYSAEKETLYRIGGYGSYNYAEASASLSMLSEKTPIFSNDVGYTTFTKTAQTTSAYLNITNVTNQLPRGVTSANGLEVYPVTQAIQIQTAMWVVGDRLYVRVLWSLTGAKHLAFYASTFYTALNPDGTFPGWDNALGGSQAGLQVSIVEDINVIASNNNFKSIIWFYPEHTVRKDNIIRVMHPILIPQLAPTSANGYTWEVIANAVYVPESFPVIDINISSPQLSYSVAAKKAPTDFNNRAKLIKSQVVIQKTFANNKVTFLYNKTDDVMTATIGNLNGAGIKTQGDIPAVFEASRGVPSTDTYNNGADQLAANASLSGSIYYSTWDGEWTKLTETVFSVNGLQPDSIKDRMHLSPSFNKKIYIGRIIDKDTNLGEAVDKSSSIKVFNTLTGIFENEDAALYSMKAGSHYTKTSSSEIPIPIRERAGFTFTFERYSTFQNLISEIIYVDAKPAFLFLPELRAAVNKSFDVTTKRIYREQSGLYTSLPINPKNAVVAKVFPSYGLLRDDKKTLWKHGVNSHGYSMIRPFYNPPTSISRYKIHTTSMPLAITPIPYQANSQWVWVELGDTFMELVSETGEWYRYPKNDGSGVVTLRPVIAGVKFVKASQKFGLDENGQIWGIVEADNSGVTQFTVALFSKPGMVFTDIQRYYGLTNTGNLYWWGASHGIVNNYPTNSGLPTEPQLKAGVSKIVSFNYSTLYQDSNGNFQTSAADATYATMQAIDSDGSLFTWGHRSLVAGVNNVPTKYGTDIWKAVSDLFFIKAAGTLHRLDATHAPFQYGTATTWDKVWTVTDTINIAADTKPEHRMLASQSGQSKALFGFYAPLTLSTFSFQTGNYNIWSAQSAGYAGGEPKVIFGYVTEESQPPIVDGIGPSDETQDIDITRPPVSSTGEAAYDDTWMCLVGVEGRICVIPDTGGSGIIIDDNPGDGSTPVQVVIPIPSGVLGTITIRKIGDLVLILNDGIVIYTYLLTTNRLSDFPLSGPSVGFYDRNWNAVTRPKDITFGHITIGDRVFTFDTNEKRYPLGEDILFRRHYYLQAQTTIFNKDGSVQVMPVIDWDIINNKDIVKAVYFGGGNNEDYYSLSQEEVNAFVAAGLTKYLHMLPVAVDAAAVDWTNVNLRVSADMISTQTAVAQHFATGTFLQTPTAESLAAYITSTDDNIISLSFTLTSVVISGYNPRSKFTGIFIILSLPMITVPANDFAKLDIYMAETFNNMKSYFNGNTFFETVTVFDLQSNVVIPTLDANYSVSFRIAAGLAYVDGSTPKSGSASHSESVALPPLTARIDYIKAVLDRNIVRIKYYFNNNVFYATPTEAEIRANVYIEPLGGDFGETMLLQSDGVYLTGFHSATSVSYAPAVIAYPVITPPIDYYFYRVPFTAPVMSGAWTTAVDFTGSYPVGNYTMEVKLYHAETPEYSISWKAQWGNNIPVEIYVQMNGIQITSGAAPLYYPTDQSGSGTTLNNLQGTSSNWVIELKVPKVILDAATEVFHGYYTGVNSPVITNFKNLPKSVE